MKHLLSAIVILAASAGALPVGSVEIEGNDFVSDSLIARAYGLSPGSQWSVEASAEGLREIFGLGYFSGAEVLVDSA